MAVIVELCDVVEERRCASPEAILCELRSSDILHSILNVLVRSECSLIDAHNR
ncbi:hypothetical protein BDZ85DRAFT_100703 [Elsinoe ampelina]|uniref:Uncharacterized protein n=1 Tax=Elsinoe ampelina TaxID=302913 RepID=A0A6A6GF38_9PEZI|nr:hypothetical protein BDZ85DRAFT_100703 [Elsinoe ampelina]